MSLPVKIVEEAAPFLLVNPDVSKMEVVIAYAHGIVALAVDYWKETMEKMKSAQVAVARMKTVRFLNLFFAMGGKVTEADISGPCIFRMHGHPLIEPKIEVCIESVLKYARYSATPRNRNRHF